MNYFETIRGFDFHCHIDLHPDPIAIINRCAHEKIFALAVTTTPKAWEQNRIWTSQNSYVCTATGLHPELIGERYAEVEMLEQQIRDSVFIGEIGLDGSQRYKKSYDRQKEVFIRVLSTAQKTGGRVLSIHSRGSARDVVEMIEEHTDPQHTLCILHWFTGTVTEARMAVAAGCYFSINQAMLSHARTRKLIIDLPLSRVLTETDSPFTMVGGRKSLPWDVITTTGILADVYGVSIPRMNSTLLTNSQQVLQFVGY